ncbi:adenosine deaminase [Methylocystis sp. WRRC1]|uniref:adenosine deaminase n=1 Tax=Methylocystis sp. WRRC1 TaxID=1732014 RepID=UPI001D156632|nr:adenosine deaminase [Methylocystis sp. WRRC1]MCC3245403.1 adenosine deaminase [Methylocystis sp. WRRC1]
MARNIAQFINDLPKAELHLHIEGTLEPEMVFKLAERNRIHLPYPSVEAMRRGYNFENLQDFLKLYYQTTRVLRTERDFFDLTNAYLARARRENIRHCEIFFDPQAHTKRNVPFGAVVEGIAAALREAAKGDGPTSRLIMCFLRDLPESDAMKTLEEAFPWRSLITGVGLDSAEVDNPPSKHASVFARARALGFQTVAHAGEEGPPAYIWEALDMLKVQRIDHGVRAIEDSSLIARLVRQKIPLTVCPLSNVRLRVYKDMAHHPLRRLAEAGVLVTINSDDPAYFGGYVNANYYAVQKAFELREPDLATFARNSFAASWLSDDDKQARMNEVDSYLIARADD